jgi:CDP-L-myo-inositol myo-inositolphosphotransferase
LESEKSPPDAAPPAAVTFASAAAADRRVAGVAAAGRVVRAWAEAGLDEAWLLIGDERPLRPATLAAIERLRGNVRIQVARPATAPAGLAPTRAPAYRAMAILAATTKASDGIVSRYFNRPISQRISYWVLKLPAARPIHATIASAVFALILFYGMLAGGKSGLILGALLFQAASVIDGVDGEMARATWRTSDLGKSLDSAVDMATNLLFLIGLTIHLGRHGSSLVLWTGLWGTCAFALGALLIALRVRAGRAPLSFDLLKPSRAVPLEQVSLGEWLMRVGAFVTSRDFFAFGFMILIIAGLAEAALCAFAAVATSWFVYVLMSLIPRFRPGFRGAA